MKELRDQLVLPGAASAVGVSVPTVLATRAAAVGGVAFVSLLAAGTLSATSVVDERAGGFAVILGIVLGFVALGLLARALQERSRLVAVRHVRELGVMLGTVPLSVIAAETGTSAAGARTLVDGALRRGEIRGRRTEEEYLADGT